MATIDFSNTAQAVDMTETGFLQLIAIVGTPSATQWVWQTAAGHKVTVNGSGMVFDSNGRAVAGQVTSMLIDLGNTGGLADIVITGLAVPAAALDDGPSSVAVILAGADRIVGGSSLLPESAAPVVVGDGVSARAGASFGGHDRFELDFGDGTFIGDVRTVGAAGPGAPVVEFHGGIDRFIAVSPSQAQNLYGDALTVLASGRLIGGADVMEVWSATGVAAGDAGEAIGTATNFSEVAGGNDTIISDSESEANLIGDVGDINAFTRVTGGADLIDGSNAAQIMSGDVGNALGGFTGGDDTIFGNGGNDKIAGDAFRSMAGFTIIGGDDELRGGDGDDQIAGEVLLPGAVLVGGNDRLFGDAGNDTLLGQSGNDVLDGGQGGDMLTGGTGNDTYYVDSYLDIVTELPNEGTDTIITTLNGLALVLGVENLTFAGTGNFEGRGNDLGNRLTGGAGEDRFTFDGSGNDTFFGLDGVDSIDYRTLGGAVINFATNVNGGAASGDRFFSIERVFASFTGADTLTAGNDRVIFIGYGGDDRLTGGAGEDSLYGGTGSDVLAGGAGNDAYLGGEDGDDIIGGGSGNDTLDGGAGDDVLDGGLGADTLMGGDGVDMVTYAASTLRVKIALDASFASRDGALGDTFNAVERVTGTDFGDVLRGNAMSNRLLGGGGNDTLQGMDGSDVLIGGTGTDALTGGAGNDFFDYTALNHGGDVIRDFVNAAGNNDTLRFLGSAFGGLPAGPLAANRFVSSATGLATTADHRFTYETDTGMVRYDSNGSGAGGVTAVATLTGAPVLTLADFVII